MNKRSSLKDRQCLYFLQGTEVIGNITIRKLYDYFGSYEAIYLASESELSQILTPKMLKRFLSDRYSKDIEAEYNRISKNGIQYILSEDRDYPLHLLELHDFPPAILVNGVLPNPGIPSVAIIGSRNCSNYGQSMAQEYARVIAQSGIQIISGMAMGIDGIAGRSALQTNGRSFAVLGSGPDVCYPTSNRDLFDALRMTGGIISEYPLGTPGTGWHFPLRNRIIAALSDALIVIEAKEKSGTMITVDAALEIGKDVYALPGRNSDAMSKGCNQLIKQGAEILVSAEDFVSEFLTKCSVEPIFSNFFSNLSDEATLKRSGPSFSNPEEKIIYESLDHTPQTLDQIFSKVNSLIPITLSQLMVSLTNLTISGSITSVSGTNYCWK